jgi:hypothetical protein
MWGMGSEAEPCVLKQLGSPEAETRPKELTCRYSSSIPLPQKITSFPRNKNPTFP